MTSDRRPVLADLDLERFRCAVADALQPLVDTGGADRMTEPTWARLHAHYQLLRRWNQRVGLIGRGSVAEAPARHYAESLAGLSFLPPAGACLDFGSGAGFPGLVLAACRPEQEFVLIESRQRKATFLSQAAAAMQLNRCRLITARWGPEGLAAGTRTGLDPAAAGIAALTARAVDLEPWVVSLTSVLTPDAVWLAWGPGAEPAGADSDWRRAAESRLGGERRLTIWRRQGQELDR